MGVDVHLQAYIRQCPWLKRKPCAGGANCFMKRRKDGRWDHRGAVGCVLVDEVRTTDSTGVSDTLFDASRFFLGVFFDVR